MMSSTHYPYLRYRKCQQLILLRILVFEMVKCQNSFVSENEIWFRKLIFDLSVLDSVVLHASITIFSLCVIFIVMAAIMGDGRVVSEQQ